MENIKERIEDKIAYATARFPGSNTINSILRNPLEITRITVNTLYDFMKYCRENDMDGTSKYREAYEAVLLYERRKVR